MCATDAVQKLIFDDMTACARSSGLRGYECPKAIFIETGNLNELGQAFTVANDCLTPSFKLRRYALDQRLPQPRLPPRAVVQVP